MNQKYQKVFAGEKAIKKRLFSLFIVQGSKVGSATNKQVAVPNGAEPPGHSPTGGAVCAAESAGSNTGDVG